MKTAIISDIHSNLEALNAVLEDIAAMGAERIICLGDIIGYGPNPRECLELAMSWQICLLGNHDHAVLFEPRDFNPIAAEATRWTRGEIEKLDPNKDAVDKRWAFLAELPPGFSEGDYLFVHGSPRQPLNEYVFPGDSRIPAKMKNLFSGVKRMCFQGHTHVPGIFTEEPDFYPSFHFEDGYEIKEGKIMCNVGSVGQPRDGDWRSCYVLLEGDRLQYRRVKYDVQKTVDKIHAIPQLDRFLGDRLLMGR